MADGKRVTLRQIGEALGLSAQAVSMALRGHRDIAAATRERVKAKAEELGYAPDPALRALAEYRAGRRPAEGKWTCVALVNDWAGPTRLMAEPTYARLVGGLEAATRARGIVLERHWLGHRGARAGAVFRQLYHRGIRGVLVAPPPIGGEPTKIEPPVDRFQVVTFGPEHVYSESHTVQFDYYENLRLAWRRLREEGRQRIGLAYRMHQGWRTGEAWEAAYHVEKRLAGFGPEELPPLVMTESGAAGERRFRAWIHAERLDAVITIVHEAATWFGDDERAPRIVWLDARRPGAGGIDLNVEQMAETAVELLLLEMQRSLAGRAGLPFRIHIPGKWVESPAQRARSIR